MELTINSKPPTDQPWCVIGDFNEVLLLTEKSGRRVRPEQQMQEFRTALEMNDIFDLGWIGDKYTWSNKHTDGTFIKERLDRGVANTKWSEIFKNGELPVLPAIKSDHRPILLVI